MQKIVNLLKKLSYKKIITKLLSFKQSPAKIAFSVALGVFLGLLLPIGFQAVVATPLALLLECNIVLTLTSTFITNPLTIVPIYYLIIKTGEILTNTSINYTSFQNFVSNPSFQKFWELGTESLIVFFTGSFILGLITAIITYFTVYFILRRHIAIQQS